jgi:hypothetical protein
MIGRAEAMIDEQNRNYFIEFLLFGSLMIMGFYPSGPLGLYAPGPLALLLWYTLPPPSPANCGLRHLFYFRIRPRHILGGLRADGHADLFTSAPSSLTILT